MGVGDTTDSPTGSGHFKISWQGFLHFSALETLILTAYILQPFDQQRYHATYRDYLVSTYLPYHLADWNRAYLTIVSFSHPSSCPTRRLSIDCLLCAGRSMAFTAHSSALGVGIPSSKIAMLSWTGAATAGKDASRATPEALVGHTRILRGLGGNGRGFRVIW